MAARGFDIRQIVRPGRIGEFLDGRISPYRLERSLRDDVFVDAAQRIRPSLLLDSGNSHKAVARVMARGDNDSQVRQTLQRLLQEAQLQYTLQHPGISPLYAVLDFPDDGLCMTLREHVEGDSLQDMIVQRGSKLPPNVVSWVLYEILQTAEYLQSYGASGKPISHGNINPHNVILAKDGRVRLTDFSLAKIVGSDLNMFEPTGSREYRAPEQEIGDAQIGTDIWGAAVTAIVAMLGDIPEKISEMYKYTIPYQLPTDAAPKALRHLLEKMVLKDYDARPSATEALDFLVEEGLVENGFSVKRSIVDEATRHLRKIVGWRPKHRSTEEVQLSRHLRMARNYARMRNQEKMATELEAVEYNARLLDLDIQDQLQETSQIYDNAVVGYGQQIIRNIVTINDDTLSHLKSPGSQNEFAGIPDRYCHLVDTAIGREMPGLTQTQKERVNGYFQEFLAGEAEQYITTQLNFIKSLGDRDPMKVIPVLQEYQRLASATGAKWDDEKARELFRL